MEFHKEDFVASALSTSVPMAQKCVFEDELYRLVPFSFNKGRNSRKNKNEIFFCSVF